MDPRRHCAHGGRLLIFAGDIVLVGLVAADQSGSG